MSIGTLGRLALVFASPCIALADDAADVETVRARLIEHALLASPDSETVRSWVDSLEPDGSWPDVDYAGESRSSWEPAVHPGRVRSMAVAWAKPNSPLQGDAELLAATLAALDCWIARDLECPNWWYNQIGVPSSLSGALLILEERLTPEARAGGVRVLERAKLGMTGQNLVWVAEITVARGCLERDPAVIAEAFGAIGSEVRVTEAEGVQVDGSFWQHGNQLYSGGYGRGFATDCALFARLAHGTTFAFSPEQIDVLSMYLLDGEQWMIRGRRFDYSAAGREITRPGSGGAQSFVATCRDMLALDPPRRSEFEAFLARLESDPAAPEPPLVGNRCFWRSDLMSHHRPGCYASVRVTSDRLLQTEIVNSENTRGRRLADGLNYLYLDGNEYDGVFPVWDWEALPGTTCERTGDVSVKNGSVGERSFAGGVSDGLYGLEAMDFTRESLRARKAWFFFDDEYVCLGAGITCPTEHPVITSLNQCLLDGDVRAGTLGAEAAPSGESALQSETWVHHDGVGYVFPAPTDVKLFAGTRVGAWSLIGPRSPDEVREDVFDLRIEHGAGPEDATYAYIVIPGVSAEETGRYAESVPVEILANTSNVQACRNTGTGVTGIAFYEPDAVHLEGLPRIEVDRPCLVLWRETEDGVTIAVADPTHGEGAVEVRVQTPLLGEGSRPTNGGQGSVLTFELPAGQMAGSSVVKMFGRV